MKTTLLDENAKVYAQLTEQSDVVAELKKGDILFFDINSHMGKFLKVNLPNGSKGYLPKSAKLYSASYYETKKNIAVFSNYENTNTVKQLPIKTKILVWGLIETNNSIWYCINTDSGDAYLSNDDFNSLIPAQISVDEERPNYTPAYIWLAVGFIALIISYSSSSFQLIIRGSDAIIPGGISYGWFAIIIAIYKFIVPSKKNSQNE